MLIGKKTFRVTFQNMTKEDKDKYTIVNVDNNKIKEYGGERRQDIATQCAPNYFATIMAKFTNVKKKIVEDLGF